MIVVEQVEKKVKDFVLGPIDFSIEPGTVTAIIGENGSGKSTLLKTMMNLYKRNHGTVKIFSKDVADGDKWKSQVAYQGQQAYGYEIFTLKEMHEFISKWYPNFNHTLYEEMVERFELPKNKKFSAMSEGMQQKMVLALTIPRNTKVLLLDEPTSFMDIPAKKYVMDLLVRWLEEDDERSLVLASHQADDIRKLADYLLIIRKGVQIDWIEKELLIERYIQYSFVDGEDLMKLPGEVSRSMSGNEIVVELCEEDGVTEERLQTFFHGHEVTPLTESRLDVEDIVTLLLEN